MMVLAALVAMGGRAAAAPWDVGADLQVAEDGVACSVRAGWMLMEKLCGVQAHDTERVSEEEVGGMERALERALPELVNVVVNGSRVEARPRFFGIEGERSGDGSYDRRSAEAVFGFYCRSVPPMQRLRLDWLLLPERFFESGALDDLIAHLEPRDRSAILGLRLGEAPAQEIEMRAGQEDFSWERAGESLPPKVADLRDEAIRDEPGAGNAGSSSRGRFVLLVVLGALIIVRLAMKSGGRRRR